ncbi:class III extradiol dioxygenase subunit B-like domain-containing protein [Streptomyces sp. YIM 98790]|uniref:class III extradiol dioxygenase subunit B-like domain-containing protein n=1 Tax=Streptomyces sp. YIM 98790 TaxID=2689077 RepID=UPI00140C4673|nr:class III extradiol dioxygenase subunit B-like domain-containing protein [Streptomyces sp. YIM 98790]
MLVAAAVCPCPPLLVPAVAGDAAAELDGARAACREAVAALAAARPALVVVVGPDGTDGPAVHPAGTRGGFHGYGLPLEVTLGTPDPARPDDGGRLPLSLTVGAWLLAEAGWTAAPVTGLAVGPAMEPDRCADEGRLLAAAAERVALLVMGDGSVCRDRKAPGYLDERAIPFDDAVARALAGADTAALAGLDPALAAELGAAGRPAWQVLSGAAGSSRMDARLLWHGAPYGVAYFTALWTAR